MFNNVILDVAIGIIFIFLLYSLLATSIQEAIATGLALRARTLKDGIINGMLADTPKMGRAESVVVGIWCFIKEFLHLFHKPEVENKKLGHLFYEHPIIKNYGSSRIFAIPSYLPGANFSTILVDVLKQDFDSKLNAIAAAKLPSGTGESEEQIRENLANSADGNKIKELLNYYAGMYNKSALVPAELNLVIDKETLQILQIHLRSSLYNLEAFSKKLETWYDDSMDRISGWYKRRVQFLLFLIGMVVAMIFNVDIIQITGKLSTDKDARDQLVQIAIKSADSYKNDPRVQRGANPVGTDATVGSDTSAGSLTVYREKMKAVSQIVDSSIVKPNQLLALGWGDFGRKADSLVLLKDFVKLLADSMSAVKKKILHARDFAVQKFNIEINKKDLPLVEKTALIKRRDSLSAKAERDTAEANALFQNKSSARLNALYRQHGIRYSKFVYIAGHSFSSFSKFLGLLLTAIAICLGAPFWFDLLNKVVNIRAAGKREENNNSSGKTAGMTPAPPPIMVNVAGQPAGEEAVG